MDFPPSSVAAGHAERMQAFLDEEVVPAESRYAAAPVRVVEELRPRPDGAG